jgi:CTD kinase subunit gamma
MSFDAFEARLHFLQLLRRLTAKVDSIQKVIQYAIRYGSRAGEDLWECITEECSKGHLNTRINILYAVDSLLEICQALTPAEAPYSALILRDLGRIVEGVVPDTREGVLNLKSTKQVSYNNRKDELIADV